MESESKNYTANLSKLCNTTNNSQTQTFRTIWGKLFLRMHLRLFVVEEFFKIVFCLHVGVKQGMSTNDECGSWYNRVGDFLVSVWDRRKETLYGSGSVGEVSRTIPTPECEVNGTECYNGWVSWPVKCIPYFLIVLPRCLIAHLLLRTRWLFKVGGKSR